MHNCNCRTRQSATPVPLPYINHCASNQELAMAYVPWQRFRELYEADQALRHGTIFKELHKPFQGGMRGRI